MSLHGFSHGAINFTGLREADILRSPTRQLCFPCTRVRVFPQGAFRIFLFVCLPRRSRWVIALYIRCDVDNIHSLRHLV